MEDHSAIAVFTGRSYERIIREGGSRAWVLDPSRARKYEYLVCTQNQDAGDWADPKAPHGSAYLVGKISGVEAAPSAEDKGRFIIRISEAARIEKPNVWDGGRNPVRYTTLEELGIDPSQLTFETVPAPERTEGEGETGGEIRPLTISEAKRGLAAAFGVSPDAIEIIVRA